MMTETWRGLVEEFLECQNAEEATAWLARRVEDHAERYGKTPAESEEIFRSSLGYMMGYYDDETAARMREMLNLEHPFLPWVGKRPTRPEDLTVAYKKGMELGKAVLKGK